MIKESDLEFFEPLWIRVSVTGLCFAWSYFEWMINESPIWGAVFGAIGIYCIYRLFVTFPKQLSGDGDSKDE